MSFSNQDLRNAGLKVTLPRIKILELLEKSPIQHLSAEEVYKALLEQGEDVGLATVYRVLTQFEAAGIVERHHFEGGHSVFEISQGEHHDHIVCMMCNKVLEFNDAIIEAQQHKVAESLGFTLTDHALHLYGICNNAECQEKANGRKK